MTGIEIGMQVFGEGSPSRTRRIGRGAARVSLWSSVLAAFALAGCATNDQSPFMDVHQDGSISVECSNLGQSAAPDYEKAYEIRQECRIKEISEEMRLSLLEQFPLGSDLRALARYLEEEDFTCVDLGDGYEHNEKSSLQCSFDSDEQFYGPPFILSLPWYTKWVRWRMTIDHSAGKISGLDTWSAAIPNNERPWPRKRQKE